ncbi:MAG TPA: NAD(P)H-dependent oxidoreductase, partial [Paracoccaceae bacterium]|nr:NAD(P)H-dependent oxidoreductase [Paracoccaceae bacterium]
MTVARPLVVGIGGTIREGSLTECALRHALARAAEAGAETLLFAGPALDLPPYDPAETSRSGPARRLVEAIRR